MLGVGILQEHDADFGAAARLAIEVGGDLRQPADGRGVALKIVDGTQRARPVVLAAVLRRLGVRSTAYERLEAAPILGHGQPVGAVVAIGIEHSRFSTGRVVVAAGTALTFEIDNTDPIGHELIVGPPEVHARHAEGTEASHPSVPGEVTLDLGGTAVTSYTFDRPGTVEFACHLPGHYQHGMRGVVEVVPAG